MQIREHAVANPDKPAIIVHPSGTVGDIRRTGGPRQPARPLLPRARSSRGRRRRDSDGEQRALPRRDVGGAPQRSVLRADQHPPDRGRGGLHRRQQQRQGDRRLGGAAQDVREPRRAHRGSRVAASSPTTIWTAGTATPNALRTSRIRRSTTRSKATCCSTRRAPPADRRASSASCRTCRPPRCPA